MTVKYLDPEEFRDAGYLQEVNRQFFHPLGLALEIKVEDGRVVGLDGVWDYRDDPEGIVYDLPASLAEEVVEHAECVHAEWQARSATRQARLGFVVQPIEEVARS